MRESALFGTMFSLGAGAVLAGVTVSRLVVGQAPEKSAEEPPAVAVETARPAAVEPPAPAAATPPPAVVPRAEIALSGQHRALPRKHRRATVAEKSAPPPAPVMKETAPTSRVVKREAPIPAPPAPAVEETAPTASIAKREAPIPTPPPAPVVQETAPTASIAKREVPTPAPAPRAQVDDPPLATDAPIARDAPIAIVRGGVARMESPAPGAHIIQVEPRDR
jgi:hypothetical protein